MRKTVLFAMLIVLLAVLTAGCSSKTAQPDPYKRAHDQSREAYRDLDRQVR